MPFHTKNLDIGPKFSVTFFSFEILGGVWESPLPPWTRVCNSNVEARYYVLFCRFHPPPPLNFGRGRGSTPLIFERLFYSLSVKFLKIGPFNSVEILKNIPLLIALHRNVKKETILLRKNLEVGLF